MADGSSPRIVIIGAGMAGLSAAHKLVTSGLQNVTVLEAADRIGGRIHTIQFGDGTMPVELGAAWIHGAGVDNSSYQLAESLGALQPYRIWNRMTGTFLRENGSEVDRDTVDDGLRKYKETQDKVQRIVSEEIAKGNREGSRYGTVLGRFLDAELVQCDQEQQRSDLKRLFNAFRNYSGVHEGHELDEISFEFPDTTPVKPGGDIHVPAGYKSLLDHLCKDLPHDSVQLNTSVVNIEWKTNSDGVKLLTGSGSTIEATHVIVTCSLGVLKHDHDTLFTPTLPIEKMDVLKSIGFGCVNKILLEYETPILDSEIQNILFSYDDISIGEMKDDWTKRILGFDKIYEKQNVLLGWVYGEAAIFLETLPETEIATTCTKLLRKFLGNPDFPEPTRTVISRWHSNPHVRGSYSFQTPNLIPNEQLILSQPLTTSSGVPIVLFAGEATHQEHYSCTHGARDSGIREAERLLQLYPTNSNSCT